MTTLRAGTIGTGWMGQRIAPDFAASPDIDLVAVGGRNPERTAAFAREHGIEEVHDVDGLLEADLDLIYLSTTHDTHRDFALRAIENGTPVLLEKAFTENAAEARELVDAARGRGVFLMEAMWMRFNPVIRGVQRWLADGAIGDPRTLVATFGFAAPYGHRLWDGPTGGGSLLDQGVYPLTLADVVLGEHERLTATGSTLGYDGEPVPVDSELGVLLAHPGGRQSVLATSIKAPLPCDAWIAGTTGSIRIDAGFWGTERATLTRSGEEPEVLEIPFAGHGYQPMLAATAEAIRNGWVEHPLCTHEMTLRTMAAIDDVRAQVGPA